MGQPVIRQKFARMAAALEAVHSYLEYVTYQMDVMDYQEQSKKLGGPIALLKYQVTRTGTLMRTSPCRCPAAVGSRRRAWLAGSRRGSARTSTRRCSAAPRRSWRTSECGRPCPRRP